MQVPVILLKGKYCFIEQIRLLQIKRYRYILVTVERDHYILSANQYLL